MTDARELLWLKVVQSLLRAGCARGFDGTHLCAMTERMYYFGSSKWARYRVALIRSAGLVTVVSAVLLASITLYGLQLTAFAPATHMSATWEPLPLIYRSKQEFLASLPSWRRP